jgi:hypothetical protein
MQVISTQSVTKLSDSVNSLDIDKKIGYFCDIETLELKLELWLIFDDNGKYAYALVDCYGLVIDICKNITVARERANTRFRNSGMKDSRFILA